MIMTKYIVESMTEPVCLCTDGDLHITPLEAWYHAEEFDSMTSATLAIFQHPLSASFNLIVTPIPEPKSVSYDQQSFL
jgi:hypothetical protein